ncbi:MAG: hypothetical protein O7F12_17835 [Nitrospirae bacterium]|nr:hypothetical protein [Nitrospirota bacterium]
MIGPTKKNTTRYVILQLSLLVLFLMGSGVFLYGTPLVDDLPDLTGGVVPLLTYDTVGSSGIGGELLSGGNLSSRGNVRYQVRVKNQSGDPIDAESLVVVVHKIQEMARLRDVISELQLPGSDGTTRDGKPYFRVPVGDQKTLPPYGVSETLIIEIQNPNLFRLYPPVLRVRGVRHTASQAFQDALETLVRRGVLTPEEANQASK